MKFQFDASQEYQQDAVASIVDIFKGQQRKSVEYSVVLNPDENAELPGLGNYGGNVSNVLGITEAAMLSNVRDIQARNSVPESDQNSILDHWLVDDPLNGMPRACPHFSVEMETGTGKTYVYLRTILELSQKFGYKKFVIVVPSIAIREGVVKSLDQMKEHFLNIYNESIEAFVYDSRNVNRLRQFASSNLVEVMVINIQAFVKGFEQNDDDSAKEGGNIIYRRSDKLSDKRPIDLIQATRPFVIIDEPQSVDNTEKAKEALTQLNPLCTLRYSATHTNKYNLMYSLDPIKAFELKLVKQVVVGEILGGDEGNSALVKFETLESKNEIRAKVALNVKLKGGIKEKSVWVHQGDSLFDKSNELEVYENGFEITEISTKPDNSYLKLSSGQLVSLGQQVGGIKDAIWEQQIDQTVRYHFEKALICEPLGIKVLSLFFIDKVLNYRLDPSDKEKLGKFGTAFEESFRKWSKDSRYSDLALSKMNIEDVHDGYFSSDRKGYKDTKGETAADEETYNLIMKDKERLLSSEVPLQFIFSHSALREGWDSPNVFQICTLNETASSLKKRQEIGRGLRLPVDQSGKRIFDESINKLTVVVNESYEEFCAKLQTEYSEDAGVKFGKISIDLLMHFVRTSEAGSPLMLPDENRRIANLLQRALVKAGIIDSSDVMRTAVDFDEAFANMNLPEELEEYRLSLKDYCAGLNIQSHVKRARNLIANRLKPATLETPEFKALWDQISPRTTYALNFNTDDFVNEVIYRIKILEPILPPRITIRTGEAKIDREGVAGEIINVQDVVVDMKMRANQDILAYLQAETDLTRASLHKILIGSKRLKDYFVNPQVFLDRISEVIRSEMGKLIVAQKNRKGMQGINYYKLSENGNVLRWDASNFAVEEQVDIDNSVAVSKSIYERVVFDSTVEKNFALDIDRRKDVLLFVKLPWWYKIDTPVGKYNPDWAIALEDGDLYYLVRETKGTTNLDKLPFEMEKTKVLSGSAHFRELGVSYEVVVRAADVKAR